MGFLLGLWAKLKFYLAAAGAVALAIGWAFLKGRREGGANERTKQYKRNEKLQGEWDEIDRERPDFDGAIGRLHDRTKRR